MMSLEVFTMHAVHCGSMVPSKSACFSVHSAVLHKGNHAITAPYVQLYVCNLGVAQIMLLYMSCPY